MNSGVQVFGFGPHFSARGWYKEQKGSMSFQQGTPVLDSWRKNLNNQVWIKRAVWCGTEEPWSWSFSFLLAMVTSCSRVLWTATPSWPLPSYLWSFICPEPRCRCLMVTLKWPRYHLQPLNCLAFPSDRKVMIDIHQSTTLGKQEKEQSEMFWGDFLLSYVALVLSIIVAENGA